MGNPFFNQFKKTAISFMQERYRDVRLLLTDTTEAEMLVEKVTNNEPCSPDERTMSGIAVASYNIDDYWRIVDVLQKRLYRVDWRHWRQSYKSLVLLEFLLSHGPEEFCAEFDDHIDVIRELGSFRHTDENRISRIDWGLNMRKRSERVLELLKGGEALIQARLKARNTLNTAIHQELWNISISSALPSSSSYSSASRSYSSLLPPDTLSSSGSSAYIQDYYATSSGSEGGVSYLTWIESDDSQTEYDKYDVTSSPPASRRDIVEETAGNFSSSIQVEDEERKGKGKGRGKVSRSFVGDLCSKLRINRRRNGRKFGFTTPPSP